MSYLFLCFTESKATQVSSPEPMTQDPKTISCFLRVEETWELWEQFRRDCQLFSDWLAQIEEEVRESEIEVRDVAVAKQEISKYEVCPHTDWILFLYFIPFYIDSHL